MAFRLFHRVCGLACALVLATPAVASATDWTQFRSDATQSGWNASETTLTPTTVVGLQTAWRRSVTGEIVTPAPLVVGGETIMGGDAAIVAFGVSTGRRLWTFSVGTKDLGNPIAAGGGRVFVESGAGPMYAIDAATGAELWRRDLGGSAYGGPTVLGDVVFVPGGGNVYALDAATGTTLWSSPASRYIANVSTPSVSDGRVVVGTLDGVHAFDAATGRAAWTYEFPAIGSGFGAPIFDGAVFAAAGRTEVKLDLATGQVVWRKTLPRGNRADATPAVGEGLVVLHVEGGAVRGDILTARSVTTGNVVWSVRFKPGDVFSIVDSSAAIAGGVVYAGFSNARVRAFAATDGVSLWSRALDGASFSSPSVANGQLEIGTLSGTLYAFRLP